MPDGLSALPDSFVLNMATCHGLLDNFNIFGRAKYSTATGREMWLASLHQFHSGRNNPNTKRSYAVAGTDTGAVIGRPSALVPSRLSVLPAPFLPNSAGFEPPRGSGAVLSQINT